MTANRPSPPGEADRRAQRSQVVGNIRVPDGRFVVIRVDANRMPEAADMLAAEPEPELLEFRIGGSAYALRRDEPGERRALDDLACLLTAREMEIAALVAAGRLNKQIAAKLRISEHTVSSYLNRIYSKLGIRSRSAVAARYAVWAGSLPRS